jgi:hypothetical protein
MKKNQAHGILLAVQSTFGGAVSKTGFPDSESDVLRTFAASIFVSHVPEITHRTVPSLLVTYPVTCNAKLLIHENLGTSTAGKTTSVQVSTQKNFMVLTTDYRYES